MVPTLIAVALALGAAAAPDPVQKRLDGKNACFLLYDLAAEAFVHTYNGPRCRERLAPCSTFKVPLALIALDAGLLQDEKTTLKWDGKPHTIKEWQRDHSTASWLEHSVVWFSQALTPKLGAAKLKAYLAALDYGNQEMGDDLQQFWLGGPLRISAYEQVDFMRRLYGDVLPLSANAVAVTKKVLVRSRSPRGAVLSGKTGTLDPDVGAQGWFVGHVLTPAGKPFVFAVVVGAKPPDGGYAGPYARSLTTEILTELGLY